MKRDISRAARSRAPAHRRPSRALGAIAILSVLVMTASGAIASDPPGPAPRLLDPAATTEDLRRLCREGSASLPVGAGIDVEAIIQRADRAVAACDRLVDGRLAGRELAEVLVDRGNLRAPGSGAAYAQALADFDRAIALEPTMADAFAGRGQAHLLYMRDLPRALRDLDAAIRLDPAKAAFLVIRASILGWLKQPDRALVDLDRAIALDPGAAKAFSVRGLTLLSNGQAARAVADFDRAIQMTPDAGELYGFRAAARRAAGDLAGAQSDETRSRELLLPKVP